MEKERDVSNSIPSAYDHHNIPNKRVEYGGDRQEQSFIAYSPRSRSTSWKAEAFIIHPALSFGAIEINFRTLPVLCINPDASADLKRGGMWRKKET